MLAHILIKEKEHFKELQTRVSIALREACDSLSMGISSF